MPFVVRSISRRVWWVAGTILGAALLVAVIFSAPNGLRPVEIALMPVPLAGLVAIGVRGMRSAILIATPYRVTVREMVKTTHWSWPIIEGFVAGTRLTPVPWLPGIRLRRRVLGVVYSGGRTRWLHELSCRARDEASTWVDASVTRLNELLAAAAGQARQGA